MNLYKVITDWFEKNWESCNGLENLPLECGCMRGDLMPCSEPDLFQCQVKDWKYQDAEKVTRNEFLWMVDDLELAGVRIKYASKIRAEGNYGGDYLVIRKIGRTRLYIEVGHCCVTYLKKVVPTEVITGLIGSLMDECGGFEKVLRKYLKWDERFKEKLIKECVNSKE